jgi:hypothetical protein
MNKENTQRIIAACPSLFQTMKEEQENFKHGKMFNPIAFGFECGDGWADLLVELCERIQTRLNEMPREVANRIVAVQVKEKYGSLRFYISHLDNSIENLIEEAMRKSTETCEVCGKPGSIRGESWYFAACDEHTDT